MMLEDNISPNMGSPGDPGALVPDGEKTDAFLNEAQTGLLTWDLVGPGKHMGTWLAG